MKYSWSLIVYLWKASFKKKVEQIEEEKQDQSRFAKGESIAYRRTKIKFKSRFAKGENKTWKK